MQNESIIMPNLRILFSQMFGQLQNPQKICPAKISRYTVVHDERLLTEAKDTYIAVFIQHWKQGGYVDDVTWLKLTELNPAIQHV